MLTPRSTWAIATIAFFASPSTGQSAPQPMPQAPDAAARPGMPHELLGGFVRNRGQWDDRTRYRARIANTAVVIEDRGLLLSTATAEHEDRIEGQAIRMRFVGADECEVTGEQQLPGNISFFLGSDDSRWQSNVARFGRVRWHEPWPGVDIVGYQKDGHLEYDVELAPGADLAAVEFAVAGADGLALADDGALVITTAGTELRQSPPVSWVVDPDGSRRPITVGYELRGDDRFGLSAPAWTGDSALVVDPGLIWSTLIGGSQNDIVRAVHVDAAGLVTVAGFTRSPDFPTTSGTWSQTFGGGPNGAGDAFVARFDPSLSGSQQLIAATFVGSGDWDGFLDMHMDASGTATLSGFCWGPNFPTVNPYSGFTGSVGTPDVVVCQLDPTLSQILYSTYVGGTGEDRGYQMDVDPATSRIAVAVHTNSTDFPVTANAPQSALGGGFDIAVLELDPNASSAPNQLVFSTYLGGSADEFPNDLQVGPNIQLTLCARTESANYPTTPNAHDATYGGNRDAVVTRIDPFQASWVYSTFFGGNNQDDALSLHVDSSGVITFGGPTSTVGLASAGTPFQPQHSSPCGIGCDDGYLARLDPSLPAGQQLLYFTYFGGPGTGGAWTQVDALTVDGNGVITFAGTTSGDVLPTTPGAWDRTEDLREDAFVARLDPSLLPASAQLLYSTFLGGPGGDEAKFLSTAGTVATVVGRTSVNAGFPTTPNAYDDTYNGMIDMFVCQIDLQPMPAPVLTTITPGAVPYWQPPTITLSGQYLHNAQSVTVGGQVASFTVVSPWQINFTLPTSIAIGAGHPVVVTDQLARQSNVLPLGVTGSPAALVAPTNWLGGVPAHYQMIGDANDLSVLLISPWFGPTSVPGIVSLGIGGGSVANLISVGFFPHGNNGVAETWITYSSSLPPCFFVHSEAITGDPLNLTLPLTTTNSISTKLW